MPTDGGNWKEAAAAEYAQRRVAAIKRRDSALGRVARIQKTVAEAEAEIAELDLGAKVFGLPIGPVEQSSLFETINGVLRAAPLVPGPGALSRALSVQAPPQFKELALRMLEQAYPNPLKASDIQEGIQGQLGRQFHWKTAGMTLYRLKTEGAVRRDGQLWFYVTPEDRRILLLQEVERLAELAHDEEEEPPEVI